MWIYGIILLIAGIIYLIIWANRPTELPGIEPPQPVSVFWRPGLYNYEGNLYERAVLRNETIDFLLGKGVYYHSVDPREWCGQHEPYLSFSAMYDYAATHGNDKMLNRFEKDIVIILKTESLTPEHFMFVIDHIIGYYRAFEDGKLTLKWQINTVIKQAIAAKLQAYISLYGSQGGPFDCHTPRHEFYTAEAIRLIEKVKEKFDVDLLQS